MKTGRTTTYINERLANLLDAHGPTGEGERNLADKLGYIIPGWDRVLRDEAAKWRKTLSKPEWHLLQAATISHAFAMDVGGPLEDDLGSVLLCVQDSEPDELGIADAAMHQASVSLLLEQASTAAQLALVWMLLRERRRTGSA